MTTLPTNAETSDELDRLLSDFFKSQLKQPWPKAPLPASGASTEPSELAAARLTEVPSDKPAPAARRDNTARSRFTLAASVALVLGASLLLSNGYRPGVRPGVPPTNGGLKMLPKSEAMPGKGGVLDQIDKNKATKDNDGGFKPNVKFE
jgi:hypothetical protein